jgi:hypothetical protein
MQPSQLLVVSNESKKTINNIPPEPELPPLRIETPPTAVVVLPIVGDGDGLAFEMLTFFI